MRLVGAKYGDVWGKLLLKLLEGHIGSLWKGIRMVRRSSLVLFNVTKIRFWHDECCGERALKELYLYPGLYLIAVNKDGGFVSSLLGFVSSLLSSRGEDEFCFWNMRFICDSHDWESDGVDF